MQLIPDLVTRAADGTPDRTAVIAPDGATTTFAEFDRQIRAVTAWVTDHSRAGDRVAVIADNSAAHAVLYYAVPSAGRVLTLINQRLNPVEQSAQLASAGFPHAGVQVGIVDATGAQATPGQVGEIVVRGAQVSAEGWLRTRDVGRVDPDGRLTVVDRLKDVIITGGENVSSREVEDVLSGHPDVHLAAVVGVADEYWGEAVCAVVVPRTGRHPTPSGLIDHVRSRLAGFKRPRHVLFVDDLPRTTNGKVAKNMLRQHVWERIGATSIS